MTTSTQIDGITTLLMIDQDGDENISRYLASEMIELFSAEQREQLQTTGKTTASYQVGLSKRTTTIVDMVAAARIAARA